MIPEVMAISGGMKHFDLILSGYKLFTTSSRFGVYWLGLRYSEQFLNLSGLSKTKQLSLSADIMKKSSRALHTHVSFVLTLLRMGTYALH